MRATIESSISFVMDLEAREATAFGLQFNPAAAWKIHLGDLERMASQWKEKLGVELLCGPSFGLVNIDKYSKWTGSGVECSLLSLAMDGRRGITLEVSEL